jgi:hypothetical protein
VLGAGADRLALLHEPAHLSSTADRLSREFLRQARLLDPIATAVQRDGWRALRSMRARLRESEVRLAVIGRSIGLTSCGRWDATGARIAGRASASGSASAASAGWAPGPLVAPWSSTSVSDGPRGRAAPMRSSAAAAEDRPYGSGANSLPRDRFRTGRDRLHRRLRPA